MRTRASTTEQDIVKDARHVHTQALKNLSGFEKAEEDKEKAITAAFLREFLQNVDDYERAIHGQTVYRITGTSATRDEEKARAEVFGLMSQFRKDAKAVVAPSPGLLAAVGVGEKLVRGSTPRLIGAAGGLLLWAEDDAAHKTELRRAGITAAKLQKLAAAQGHLSGADEQQDLVKGEAKGETISKRELQALVKKKVAQVRKSAAAAFSERPEVLAPFASTLPRHTPKKRTAKKAEPRDEGSK